MPSSVASVSSPTPPSPPPPGTARAPWERPQAPFVLSLLGGLVILLVGLFFFLFVYTTSPSTNVFFGVSVLFAGVWGMIDGTALLAIAILMYLQPERHFLFGVLVLGFSILSLLAYGGLLVGFAVAAAGGITALIWTPTPPGSWGAWGYSGYAGAYSPMAAYPYHACLKCGHMQTYEARFCARCGTAMV
jgi:hypothetical protein